MCSCFVFFFFGSEPIENDNDDNDDNDDDDPDDRSRGGSASERRLEGAADASIGEGT